jgi:dephospho-CoA kinase
MLIVGLTGGVGTGKTTVSNMFAALGVPIIDADIIAHDVTRAGQPALKNIVAHFGKAILKNDQLDRTQLREIIFNHPDEKRWLEQLLHPIIIQQIKNDIQHIDAPYCIVAIPLLFESGPYDFIDRVLVVDADIAKQTERVAARDKTVPAEVTKMINAQWPREQKRERADDIITNEGSLIDLEKAVKALHQQYLQFSQ